MATKYKNRKDIVFISLAKIPQELKLFYLKRPLQYACRPNENVHECNAQWISTHFIVRKKGP
jgi:hypothetical protein